MERELRELAEIGGEMAKLRDEFAANIDRILGHHEPPLMVDWIVMITWFVVGLLFLYWKT